eukprot:jgi/Tetstr1/444492/TSEL_032373.t1
MLWKFPESSGADPYNGHWHSRQAAEGVSFLPAQPATAATASEGRNQRAQLAIKEAGSSTNGLAALFNARNAKSRLASPAGARRHRRPTAGVVMASRLVASQEQVGNGADLQTGNSEDSTHTAVIDIPTDASSSDEAPPAAALCTSRHHRPACHPLPRPPRTRPLAASAPARIPRAVPASG